MYVCELILKKKSTQTQLVDNAFRLKHPLPVEMVLTLFERYFIYGAFL